MDDIKKINVGGISIGIKKLDQVITDMKAEYADRSDQEVAAEMLNRMEKRNYIPSSARDEYSSAFVREFRKTLGQPYKAGSDGGLEIRVVGPGCPRCDQLFGRVMKVLTELGEEADLVKITEANAIAATGVLVTPGLIINGKVVSTGKVPSEREIRRLLQ
ncbi:thioredoxin family protein [Dethiosulfatarculus sandiegensis]|uniref:thioredoxin family protein n=1 Tax=Dethiosulfatarculus sandiegensis TaxID=1429043 RepID=UPI000697B8AF|nr:thioredoxin family protein [Dethiosulfatarculus sandiegensis]